MKRTLVFACAFVLWTIGCTWGYSPIIDGAVSELEISVRDDSGDLLSDADVSVVYYVTPEKVNAVHGTTDTNGLFRCSGQTIGEVHVNVSKRGYYNSCIQPPFRQAEMEEVRLTRKWASTPVSVPVVLKKIRNPAHLILNGGDFQEMSYPATNVVLGFDLELFDWCPPFGRGKYDDLQLEYDFWRSPTNWFQVYSHLVLTMTNGVDGLYLAPVDEFSQLRHCHAANPGEVYLRRLEFVYDRRSGEVTQSRRMPQNEYMVFRTRTQTNDCGEVVSSNYGLIFEKGKCGVKWNVRAYFNPIPNDTNLECIEEPRGKRR